MRKVPIKSLESKLDAEAKGRVKQVRVWKDKEGLNWDDLVKSSALFALGLGAEPAQSDPSVKEVKPMRKA
ncbi:hypothetical protein CsSME_00050305 [Camellia sinensis var. sinensis]